MAITFNPFANGSSQTWTLVWEDKLLFCLGLDYTSNRLVLTNGPQNPATAVESWAFNPATGIITTANGVFTVGMQVPNYTVATLPASGQTLGQVVFTTDDSNLRVWNGASWQIVSPPAIPINAASGGTGRTTLPAHGVLIGEGTSPVNSVVLTQGQLLKGVTGADPVGLAIGTANQVVGMNTGGTDLEYKTLAGSPSVIVTPTAGQIAFASAGMYGVRNLVAQQSSGTAQTFSADWIMLINPSTFVYTIFKATGTLTNTITTSNNLDGTDGSALASGQWLHFYAITNGAALHTVSSTTAPTTGPNLAGGNFSGYTQWAYLGAIWNTLNTGALRNVYFRGAQAYYQAVQSVLSAGAATVETSISLANFVPPNALSAYIDAQAGFPGGNITTNLLHVRLITGVDWQTYAAPYQNTSGSFPAGGPLYPWPITIPNISQQYFYLWGAASGSYSAGVAGYRMPNGGE